MTDVLGLGTRLLLTPMTLINSAFFIPYLVNLCRINSPLEHEKVRWMLKLEPQMQVLDKIR